MQASSAQSDELCDSLGAPDAGARAETVESADAPSQGGACPADMNEVEGDFCPFLEQTCLRRPKELPYRCLEYKKPSGPCQTGTTHKHFCVDTYEWPNRAGEMPVVMKSWYEARAACQSIGKRLCTEDEWTLACEGPERVPYPYGYERDATACNIDKPHLRPDEEALSRPDRRAAEMERLWQGEPSGTRARCVSPFGVHDMTGNVDEWTVNETGKPHRSALKGGYWSWVRGRCRAVTPGHDEFFTYYQIGWRCCAEAAGEAAATANVVAAAPPPAPSPPPAPAPPPVAPPPATSTPAVAPAPSQKGTIVVPESASGHRVFVDGRIFTRRSIEIECGRHAVKIGHDRRERDVDVPCGGRIELHYP